jgi:molybdate/tungstate transport system substrate-binding protein
MWQFATSVSPSLRRLVTLAVVALALLAGFVGGWAVGARSPGGSAGGPTTLSITAAGSLAVTFPAIASAFAAATPNVAAPVAAQQYAGSLAALAAVSGLHERFDVAATADYRLIPELLEPQDAGWEIVFASDPVVLAYDPTVAAWQGVNATNWAVPLATEAARLGVANASIDPMGYNAIFVLQLEGLREGAGLGALYGQFFAGAPGAFAEPRSDRTLLAPETQAAALLGTHAVGAFFVYRSYAQASGLRYVDLAPEVDLGATNDTAIAFDARAATTIVGAAGPSVVRGAPVLFGVTVPSNAPDAFVGELFVAFLLSPRTSATLAASGFAPLGRAWTDRAPELPVVLAGLADPLPAGLAGAIA